MRSEMSSSSSSSSPSPSPSLEEEQWISTTKSFLGAIGQGQALPQDLPTKDAFSHLLRGLLSVHHISPARISCSFTVNPAFANAYNTLHGGAVGVISEAVAVACAKTVSGDHQDLFLGEWAGSYLSAAKLNDEVQIDGVVLRHGRSVIVTSVDFKIKQTGKLIYSTRATFYTIPAAKL